MIFEEVVLIVLEEGIFLWWYGEVGWVLIILEVLKVVELFVNMSIKEVWEYFKMKVY